MKDLTNATTIRDGIWNTGDEIHPGLVIKNLFDVTNLFLHQMFRETIKNEEVNSSKEFISIAFNLHEHVLMKNILRSEATPKVVYLNFISFINFINSNSTQKLENKPNILLETCIKLAVFLYLLDLRT